MAKKKIVILSTMGLDVNISIIKRLREKYDVYFFFSENEGEGRFGDWKSSHIINRGDTIKELALIKDFVDLTKTFLVKHPEGLSYKKITVEFETLHLVRKINPDVILTDCTNIIFWLPRWVYKKKCISIIHDPIPHSGEDTFGRKLSNRFLVHWGQRYVLFNNKQEDEFSELYHIPKNKIYCSFLSQYEFMTLFKTQKELLPKEPEKLKVLFTGRISPYKGIKYLYEATKQYLSSRDDIHVVIAGKGNIDVDMSDIDSKYLTIYNRFIESDELYSLINWCDIVVCPYTDATQSGVIMSAYALCKPVLATKVGGLPEMLMDGKLGYLVPPKDSDSLCKAFEHLATHKDELQQFSANIKSVYFGNGEKSWNKSVEIIEQAIESIC